MNGLRSKNSAPLCLRFLNKYDKTVDIIWISHNGQYHVYATLKPAQYLDVNTYTKHYWVFRDSQSRTPVVANNKWHFCGEESGYLPYRAESPTRYVVLITHHFVTKLRSICINFLCNSNHALKRCSDVKYLEIPVTLKKEIIKRIHARDQHSHDQDR